MATFFREPDHLAIECANPLKVVAGKLVARDGRLMGNGQQPLFEPLQRVFKGQCSELGRRR